MSGGQSGAEQGILSVMAGGAEEDFARVRPLLDCYARIARRLGPAGSGQLTKVVNQVCFAGLVQSLAEALHFARAAGLGPEAVVEVISKGAAQSWQMENRHRTMVEGRFDFGFAVDHQHDAVDERGGWQHQRQRGVGDLLGIAVAAQPGTSPRRSRIEASIGWCRGRRDEGPAGPPAVR